MSALLRPSRLFALAEVPNGRATSEEDLIRLVQFLEGATEMPVPGLSTDEALLNGIFWFHRLAALVAAERGPDSGIEDQALALLEWALERAPEVLDLRRVDEVLVLAECLHWTPSEKPAD